MCFIFRARSALPTLVKLKEREALGLGFEGSRSHNNKRHFNAISEYSSEFRFDFCRFPFFVNQSGDLKENASVQSLFRSHLLSLTSAELLPFSWR